MCNNNRIIPPESLIPLPIINPDDEIRTREQSEVREGQIIGEFLISPTTGKKIKIVE